MDAPACGSCKITFIASDIVFATQCGHLFHDICLGAINYGRAKKCPECEIICLRSQSLRIFLPFQEEPSTPESLVNKCKMMKHELREVQKELDSGAELQTNLDELTEKATAMKNQKIQKAAELKELIKEKENLQKNINEKKKLFAVRNAFSETQNYYDADKLLAKKVPADTLATMAAAMKRETARSKDEKTVARTLMREERKKNEALVAKHKSLREKYDIAVARSIRRGQN